MASKILLRLLMGAMLASVSPTSSAQSDPDRSKPRPNFLIIVADDLGFSDLGAFGGEISTPNLDALAQRGIRLSAFYTSPACSPTRSMLLSGTDNHLAGLGSMAERIAPNQRGKPGYEGYLRHDVASLAEIMAAGGYRTFFSGKWHLGLQPDQNPNARGFQHSFALLQGGHNHFGTDISTNPREGAAYTENGAAISVLPPDFYSSDAFTSKLIGQLQNGTRAGSERRPFLAYLAYTAPHWPLQAPKETIAKYRGRYDAGFDALRVERLRKQVKLGLLAPSAVPHEPTGGAHTWDSLSPAEKRSSARAMEIYAAMVDRMDQNVGRVLEALEKLGELENTVILFMSDNGAEGNDIPAPSLRRIGGNSADNSLENLGSASSVITYGSGWAQAATAPSWLYKAYATEGGTRAPAFIVVPWLDKQGRVAGIYTSVMDVLPTFVQLAGLDLPSGMFAGRSVQPVRGISWAGWLEGKEKQVYSSEKVIGTELFGSRSIRRGNWKIVDKGDSRWRLFNVFKDPGETLDLSADKPRLLNSMLKAWEEYAREVGVVMPESNSPTQLPPPVP